MYVFPLKGVSRPGALTFRASWPASGPGLTLAVSEDVPPQITGPTSVWKTFDRPGSEGQALVDPQPNRYLQSSGTSLFFNIPAPGAPLITTRTFSKDGAISIEAVLECTFPDGGGYAGPSIYLGEALYGAVYIVPASPTMCQVAVFTPNFSTSILPFAFPQGEVHALRQDYFDGKLLTYLDAELIDVRSFIRFTGDPHAALFLCGAGNIGRYDVFTG